MEALIKLSLQGQRAVESGLKRTAKAEEGIGTSAKKAARNTLLWATAGTAVVKALYDIGATFDDAFDTIRTQTGATGARLQGLEGDFRAVVKTVPSDFGSASTAIGLLNSRLDLTGRALQNRSAQFLNLSRITKTDLGGNIESVTRLFGGWDVASSRQASTLDILFRASQRSGAGVAELAKNVQLAGPTLRQLGLGLDESIALFSSFEKSGVSTAQIMPGLKFALKSFLTAGKDPGKELQRTLRGVQDGTISSAAALKIFGARAGPQLVEAIKSGRFEVDKMTAALGKGDTINKAAKDTADLSEAWQVFKNRALLKIEPIATKIFLILGAGMNKLPGQIEPATNAISGLVGWLGRNKDIVLAVSGGLATYFVLMKAYAAYTAIAAFVTGGWTTAFWALDAAMAANPVGLVVVAIAALAAGFIYAYKHSETFRNAVNGAWGVLKDGFGWVKGHWPLLLSILTGPFGAAAIYIARHFDSIVGTIRSAVNAVIDVINLAIKAYNAIPLAPDIGLVDKLATPIPSAGDSGRKNTPAGLKGSGSRRASGGPVAAGHAYVVNERGTEILQMGSRGGYVHDAKSSAAMMAGGGGLDEASIARIVAAVMRGLPDFVVQIGREPIARASVDQFRQDKAYAT
jgi:TP901 family phage tail tape measure protein